MSNCEARLVCFSLLHIDYSVEQVFQPEIPAILKNLLPHSHEYLTHPWSLPLYIEEQNDPAKLQWELNLETDDMEAQRRELRSSRSRSRRPLSDCTNIDSHIRGSSQSSSSSVAKPLNPTLSSVFKNAFGKINRPATTLSSSSNGSQNASNPSALSLSVVSTPSRPAKSSSPSGTVESGTFEPVTVYCRRKCSDKKKRKGRAATGPLSGTTMPKIVNNRWEKSNGIEGVDPPKPLKLPCKKRQRVKSSEQDVSKNGSLKDFIKEQRAYFDEIDKFELQEEEVESVYELD
ncbi:hypothetical protein L6164_029794 [Bauhinia variegata]|uniref:Uncharacterized protein n=1 Tax=Bauhinia variegata TaxID=167791 RepID=A0ACB9LBN5_BAUVA|nr:hypothetical protein L6164_029794 [Bauhinia variegata]